MKKLILLAIALCGLVSANVFDDSYRNQQAIIQELQEIKTGLSGVKSSSVIRYIMYDGYNAQHYINEGTTLLMRYGCEIVKLKNVCFEKDANSNSLIINIEYKCVMRF